MLFLFLSLFGFAQTQVLTTTPNQDNNGKQPAQLIHLQGVYSNKKALDLALAADPELAKNPMMRPQNILLYPVWEVSASETWYYIGWYSPEYKEKALDEAFLRFELVEGVLFARMYAVPPTMNFSMEWTKKTPFEGLSPNKMDDYLNTVLNTQELDGGGIRLFSPEGQPFERKQLSAAAYKYVNFDMHFHPKSIASQTSFLDAEKNILMIQSLDFSFEKVSKSVKSYL